MGEGEFLKVINFMAEAQSWYIVKRPAGNCEIVTSDELEGKDKQEIVERWGSFDSQGDAIAKRVGLIRAGKCQPV